MKLSDFEPGNILARVYMAAADWVDEGSAGFLTLEGLVVICFLSILLLVTLS